jgi:hypothetical protein
VSGTLFFVAFALSLVCSLIMLIRIFKSSVLLGVLSLFFFPATIVALVRNWNDPDTDIKVPFFLSLLLGGFIVYSVYTTALSVVDEQIMLLSDADIMEMAEGDPEFAAMMRHQRDTLRDEHGWNEEDHDGESIDLDSLRVSIQAERRDASEPAGFEPLTEQTQLRLGFEAAANTLKFQRGTARFESARAELPIPKHFRFVPVDQLEAQARVRERDLGPGTFGWIVHERVDMGHEQAWWTEVRFHADGHMASGSDSLNDIDAAWRARHLATLDGPFLPSWNNQYGIATWVEKRSDGRYDVLAARPTRHGLLRFEVPAVSSDQLELALRSSRLLAARTRLDRGWAPRDHRPGQDRNAGLTLGQWISSYRSPTDTDSGAPRAESNEAPPGPEDEVQFEDSPEFEPTGSG